MGHNPYIPDNYDQAVAEQSQLGMWCGLLLSLAIQAGVGVGVLYVVNDGIRPLPSLLAVLGIWLFGYLAGWALHGRVASERSLDPEKCRTWERSASEAAGDATVLALAQFLFGSSYVCIQHLRGRR